MVVFLGPTRLPVMAVGLWRVGRLGFLLALHVGVKQVNQRGAEFNDFVVGNLAVALRIVRLGEGKLGLLRQFLARFPTEQHFLVLEPVLDELPRQLNGGVLWGIVFCPWFR